MDGRAVIEAELRVCAASWRGDGSGHCSLRSEPEKKTVAAMLLNNRELWFEYEQLRCRFIGYRRFVHVCTPLTHLDRSLQRCVARRSHQLLLSHHRLAPPLLTPLATTMSMMRAGSAAAATVQRQ